MRTPFSLRLLLPLGVLVAAFVFALGGCGGSEAPSAWTSDPNDILVDQTGCTDSIRVDLFLDATSSMSGYAAAPGSIYLQFLDNLESAVSGAWADDSLNFYKFGTTVRRIDRDEFRTAREAAFYREQGIFTTTNIDAVIDRVGPGRVGVIVTDLFQDDGDINVMVAEVKEHVFQEHLAAGVLALTSPFAGRIYDAPGGPYEYTSTSDPNSLRPFYALMFGEAPCLRRLHDALSSQPFVSGEHFLLLDRTLVEDYTVSLEKTRDSQELNRRASPGENAFAFDVRPEGEGGTLEGVVLLDRETVAPDVNAERLTLEVFRKERGPQAADSTLSDDLRLRSVERRGDSLLTLFDYTLGETGRFTYLARLRAGDIGGLVPPAWVQDLSSPNPTATQDPNRTLNLEKFVADLAQAAASAHRPVLAQFTLDVTKR